MILCEETLKTAMPIQEVKNCRNSKQATVNTVLLLRAWGIRCFFQNECRVFEQLFIVLGVEECKYLSESFSKLIEINTLNIDLLY